MNGWVTGAERVRRAPGALWATLQKVTFVRIDNVAQRRTLALAVGPDRARAHLG